MFINNLVWSYYTILFGTLIFSITLAELGHCIEFVLIASACLCFEIELIGSFVHCLF